MKAIDKIRLILGEEDFEKFLKNYYSDSYFEPTKAEVFCERNQQSTILNAFTWSKTLEGRAFWCNLSRKIYVKWDSIEDTMVKNRIPRVTMEYRDSLRDTIIFPRTITEEEHDEIFRMFVLAYYGFIKIDEYSVTRFFEENSIMDRLYDALRSEE